MCSICARGGEAQSDNLFRNSSVGGDVDGAGGLTARAGATMTLTGTDGRGEKNMLQIDMEAASPEKEPDRRNIN